jgi:hypothetical protein
MSEAKVSSLNFFVDGLPRRPVLGREILAQDF